MSMIRLGIVGYGSRIDGVIQHPLRGACPASIQPDIRVAGIVDPDETGARSRLADCDQKDVVLYGSLDEMVRNAKLDGLMIGTRCNLHTPLAIQATEYDLPLYLEKPVAVSMEQATALETAFENARCEVVVSFPLEVTTHCNMARKLIEDGAVGRPEHVQAVNYVPYATCYWERGYRDYEITQGLFLQKSTHDFSYLMSLLDSPVIRIAAMASMGRIFGGNKPAELTCKNCDEQWSCLESPQNRIRNGSGGALEDHLCVFSEACGSPESGMNEDCSSALFEFASGAHGVYSQVFFARRDAGARGATVSGYEGTISFDWFSNEIKQVRHHEPVTSVSKASGGDDHFGGDHELARDFLGLIEGRIKKSRTPIETGIRSVYTCLAAKESAGTGQFVNVRQLGQVSSMA
jgi:predicted dehydrogenase